MDGGRGHAVARPALVALGVLPLPPHEPALRAPAILFAAMPMLSILPILAQPHGEAAFSAALATLLVAACRSHIGSAMYMTLLRIVSPPIRLGRTDVNWLTRVVEGTRPFSSPQRGQRGGQASRTALSVMATRTISGMGRAG